MTQPYDVLHASELFQQWLADLKGRAMLQTHNQSQAMFRAVLHRLRGHMAPAQILTFADALPPLPRGIFVEGWRLSDPVPLTSIGDFLREVIDSLSPHHVPPESIVGDVFAVLNDRSEPHDAAILRDQLPAPVLWSAGDLLAGPRLGRVRRCANPECGWLFLDESRAGKRRWCSMQSCGNHAKARRHDHHSRPE